MFKGIIQLQTYSGCGYTSSCSREKTSENSKTFTRTIVQISHDDEAHAQLSQSYNRPQPHDVSTLRRKTDSKLRSTLVHTRGLATADVISVADADPVASSELNRIPFRRDSRLPRNSQEIAQATTRDRSERIH